MDDDSAIEEALDTARQLIEAGTPIFFARPALDASGEWMPTGGTGKAGYVLPPAWQNTTPDLGVLETWRDEPRGALCMVTGHGVDVVDLDPRNGSEASWGNICAADGAPYVLGEAVTPSGGRHLFVNALDRPKGNPWPGVDVQAGRREAGRGRGFVFLAPTLKRSKEDGALVRYAWVEPPNLEELDDADPSLDYLREHLDKGAPSGEPAPEVPHAAWDAMGEETRSAVRAVVAQEWAAMCAKLRAAAGWPEGERDAPGPKGRGWQKLAADACWLAAGLAGADWNDLDLDTAERMVSEAVPPAIARAVGLRQTWEAHRPRGLAAPVPYPAAAIDVEVFCAAIEARQRERPQLGAGGGLDPIYPTERPGDDAGREPSSWAPRSLDDALSGVRRDPAPVHLTREDGRAVFYPGRVNGILGPSESGKTWVALYAVAQAVQRGESVTVLDFEDTDAGLVSRLRALGLGDDEIRERVAYVAPDGPLGAPERDDLGAHLRAHAPGLVVLDGFNAAMQLLGLDINSNNDATKFFQVLLKPLAATGATVVYIDHTPKSKEDASKGGIGAQAKRAMTSGCAIRVEVVKEFGKGTSGGCLRLRVDKDRTGHVRGFALQRAAGPWVGDVRLDSEGEERLRVRFVVPIERGGAGDGSGAPTFRPTTLMRKVSDLLAQVGEPLSTKRIEEGVTGKRDAIRQAVEVLVAEQYVEIREGARRARLHVLVRPFVEVNLGDLDDHASTSPRPRPDLAPGEVEHLALTTSPQPPFPVGEGARSRGGVPSPLGDVESPTSPGARSRSDSSSVAHLDDLDVDTATGEVIDVGTR